MDKDFKAENVELCQRNAGIVNAKYFVYDFDEQNCVLHSSTEKQCDLIFGPPTPAYDAESCDGKNDFLLIVIVACIGFFLILFYVMLMILFSKLEIALCLCKMKCCSRSEDTQIIIEHEHNMHPIVLKSGQQLF